MSTESQYSTNISEARIILEQRKQGSFVLTAEFADRVCAIVQTLPPEITFSELQDALRCGSDDPALEEWVMFIDDLSSPEKGRLTYTLSSLAGKDSVLNPTPEIPPDTDVLSWKSPERNLLTLGEFLLLPADRVGWWRTGKIVNAFQNIAFAREVPEQ